MFKYTIIIILANIVFGESGLSSCFPDDCKNNSASVVALILARGGSKGIPRKNLVRLNGISLLGRTLTILHEAQLFFEIWVSTEDLEIKKEAIKYQCSGSDQEEDSAVPWCLTIKEMGNLEITFALIKPHVLKNVCALRRVQDVIKDNFIIVKKREILIDQELGSRFYEEHNNGALVHDRPDGLAQDSSSSLDAVRDFASKHANFEKIALFQCTSVFLTANYIRTAFDMFQTKECVFSATRSYKLRWSINNEGRSIPMNFDPANRPRRQDWSGELVENGMFYFANRELILKNLLQSDRCSIVEVSTCDSLEIDTISDLRLAKCLIEQQHESYYL